MTLKEIAGRRLISQQLTASTLTQPEEVVRGFAAVQGQEYALSKWAIGLRIPASVDADVEKAISDGRILRTHILRPTWHFVAAEDIHWMLMLSAPRVHVVNRFMYRKSELDEKLLKKAHRILSKSLEGGKQLTRDELNAEFRKKKIIAESHRLSYIMMHAELEGVITSGARRGNQFTYALLEERAPAKNLKTYDEAIAELSTRYFLSRGPARIRDFSTWSGLTIADCRRGVDILGKRLSAVKSTGDILYYNPEVEVTAKLKPEMILLPVYDEYIMGYKDRTAILQMRNLGKTPVVLTFDSTIVYDGQIIGTWRRIPGKKQIDLEYVFFNPLTSVQMRTFVKAVKRYEEFTKLKVLLRDKGSVQRFKRK